MKKEEKTHKLEIEFPLSVWQELVALSADAMREEDNMIFWLIHEEWKRGNIYTTTSGTSWSFTSGGEQDEVQD